MNIPPIAKKSQLPGWMLMVHKPQFHKGSARHHGLDEGMRAS